MPLEDFIRESIVDPDAYVARGLQPPGTMPSFETDPAGAARRACAVSGREHELSPTNESEQMSAPEHTADTHTNGHANGHNGHNGHGHHGPPPPRTGWRRWTGPGWLPRPLDDAAHRLHRPRHRLRDPLGRRLGADLVRAAARHRRDDLVPARLPRRASAPSTTGSTTAPAGRRCPRTTRATARAAGATTSARTPTTR